MPKCFPWCVCRSRKRRKRNRGLVNQEGYDILDGGTLQSNAGLEINRYGTAETVLTFDDIYGRADLDSSFTSTSCSTNCSKDISPHNLARLEAAIELVAAQFAQEIISDALVIFSQNLGVEFNVEDSVTSGTLSEESMSTISCGSDLTEDVAITHFVTELLGRVIEKAQRQTSDTQLEEQPDVLLKESISDTTSCHEDVKSTSTESTEVVSPEESEEEPLAWDNYDFNQPLFGNLRLQPAPPLVTHQEG